MSKKFSLQNAIITLIVGWLVLFVLIPNLMIIGTSFLTRDEANLIEMTFTLDNYARLLDPLYVKVLLHSFYMAIVATLICWLWATHLLTLWRKCHTNGVHLCCFW